jgi:integrase/recombinase XerD
MERERRVARCAIGAVSAFAPGFVDELLGQGYRPGTAAKQLQLMAHLSRWMAERDLEPGALRGVEIERFVGDRRASGRVQLASARALVPLLRYLRDVAGAPAAASREAPTPAGALLVRYADYLPVQRGLAVETVRGYCNTARVSGRSRAGRRRSGAWRAGRGGDQRRMWRA